MFNSVLKIGIAICLSQYVITLTIINILILEPIFGRVGPTIAITVEMVVDIVTRVVLFDFHADFEQARMRNDPILGLHGPVTRRHGNRVENEADYVHQDGDHAPVDLVLAVAHPTSDGEGEKPFDAVNRRRLGFLGNIN